MRSLFPSEHQTIAKVDKAALIESVKRVALVAERNTAVQLAFSDGVLTLDAGSGRRGAGLGVGRGADRRRGHHHRVQPAVPARRAHRHRPGRRRARVHPGLQAGRDLRLGRRVARIRFPLPPDAAPPAVLNLRVTVTLGARDPPLGRGSRNGHRTGRSRQDGRQHAHPPAQGRPHRRRLRPQPRRLRRGQPGRDGRAAALPQGRLGDGPGRRPDPRATVARARRPARRGRPRRRRRQLPLDRRPGQRRPARREGRRLRRLRRLRRGLGSARTATP